MMRFLQKHTAAAACLLALVLLSAVPVLAEGPVTSSDPGVSAWGAEYFDNPSLVGPAKVFRVDARIDNDWGIDSPIPGQIPADNFSVRWGTTVNDMPAGVYRFVLTVDDGARLYVNERLVIDRFIEGQAVPLTVDVELPGGNIPMRVEYFEATGAAVAKLYWSRLPEGTPPSDPILAVPSAAAPPGSTDAIKDNLERIGFVWDGNLGDWVFPSTSGGYGGSYQYTLNHAGLDGQYNWARWYPFAPANRPFGTYEVTVYIPTEQNLTNNARYWVKHAGGYTNVTIDQAASAGRWVSLGTYQFFGTGDEFISLSAVTFEPFGTKRVVFDAVALGLR